MNGQSASQKDSNAILNACRDIDQGIETVSAWLAELRVLQTQREHGTGVDAKLVKEIENLTTKITGANSNLIDRLKKIISDPQSGSPRNAPQVGRVQRRLKGALREYQETRLDHSNKLKDQSKRAIRIVKPDATDAEVTEAAENPDRPVFTSAVRYHDHRIHV